MTEGSLHFRENHPNCKGCTLTCLITEHVRLATPDFPSTLFALFATCSLSRFDFSSKMFVYCTIVHLSISKSKRFFCIFVHKNIPYVQQNGQSKAHLDPLYYIDIYLNIHQKAVFHKIINQILTLLFFFFPQCLLIRQLFWHTSPLFAYCFQGVMSVCSLIRQDATCSLIVFNKNVTLFVY